jgi:hypothetical protein
LLQSRNNSSAVIQLKNVVISQHSLVTSLQLYRCNKEV